MTSPLAVFANFGVIWKNWSHWILTLRDATVYYTFLKDLVSFSSQQLFIEHLLCARNISRLIINKTKICSQDLCFVQVRRGRHYYENK